MKKTNPVRFLIILLIGGLLPLTFSDCNKNDPAVTPVVSTSSVFNIAATSATAGGAVSWNGGADVTSYGVCWGTLVNPTLSNFKTNDGSGTGQFVSSLTGLAPGTAYHLRAYAVNSAGTSYGADISFATLGQSPLGLTQSATNISTIGATLNGIINPNNLSTIVTFEYGPTTAYGQSVSALQSPVSGDKLTIVNAEISGLTVGTVYHFRVKTVNSLGTVTGTDLTFTTGGQGSAAVTQPATNISTSSATLNAAVNPNAVSTSITFEYGTDTMYGQTATVAQSPVTGSNIKNISQEITSLSPGTTYHYRVKCVNSYGTIYGGDIVFVTLGLKPESATVPASNISQSSAILHGIVNANYLSTVVTFEYGTSISYGQTASASQNPVTGKTITNVSASISGISPNTLYHFRLKAVNSLGTTYSNDLSFTTLSVTTSGTPIVVFSNYDDIYSCNIDGTNLVKLTNGSTIIDYNPRINFSKTSIAFNSNRTGTWEVFTMNIDGSNVKQISTTGVSGGQNNGSAGGLDWTPDGKILYTKGTKIYKMNSDGSGIIEIATAPSDYWSELRCSPNGDKIIAQTQGSWGYNLTIYLMNIDGLNMTTFAPDLAGVQFPACFSLDGLSFLYSYDLSGHEESSGQSWNDHIISKKLDGSGTTDLSTSKLSGTNDIRAVFIPDGTKILFTNNVIADNTQYLWVMNNDGTNRTLLISSVNVYSVDCK